MQASTELIVELARLVTVNLIEEWQQDPFQWDTEMDFHAELVGRLSTCYRTIGESAVTSPSGPRARVTAASSAYYPSEPKRKWCYPDIAVRDDSSKDVEIADWPLLWVCEIKHSPYVETDADTEKLRLLLKLERVRAACCIKLWREPAIDPFDQQCDPRSVGGPLWIYTARPFSKQVLNSSQPAHQQSG